MVVLPDGRGEGEQALQHPGDRAGRGVPAVCFEVDLSLQVSLTDSMS